MAVAFALPQPPPLLDADVQVTVESARHLPRGLLAPRAKVQLFSPFSEEPLAESEAFARSTAPEWNFSVRLQLPHISGVLPVINVVILDAAGVPQTPLGKTSLTICATNTRAWVPLKSASTRADVLIIVTWPRCMRIIPPSLPTPPPPTAKIDTELRSVDPRPGALFRDGTLVVDVVAVGIPASVAQPFVTVRTHDQVLRSSETDESRSWWKRRCEKQAVTNENEKVAQTASVSLDALSIDDGDGGEISSPCSPNSQIETESNDEELSPRCSTNANVPDDGTAISVPHMNASRSVDAIQTSASNRRYVRSDNTSFSRPPPTYSAASISKPPTKSGGLRRRALTRASSTLTSLSKETVKQNTKSAKNTLKSKAKEVSDPLAKSTLNSISQLKPTRSGVGAVVTSAKIRRPSKTSAETTREVKPSSTAAAAAPPPPPVAVLQTLLAPRVRRPVDFGRFAFAELSGLPSTKLSITVTDSDSRLPDALGAVFEAELPLALVGTPGSSTILSTCENGPIHSKASVWVRVTRIRNPKGASAHCTVVTSKFEKVLKQIPTIAGEFKNKYPQAEKLTYLLVGGLFTNYYPLYFSRNVDYLQQTLQLARVQVVPINTESGLTANARVIAASIAKTATRRNSVVLIGHSKGGVDILETLTNHIEIIPFIYGVISFQAPFLGTYAIDYLTNNNLADAIGNALETLWHGQRQSLLDLSYAARAKSLQMFNSPNGVEGTRAMVLRDVPIISVASCASFELHSIRSAANAAGIASMAAIATIITNNTGFSCDGLVVPADAMIPFCDLVYALDMMHTEPALYVPGTDYPPGEMTAALLILLFEKAERDCDNTNKSPPKPK